MTELYSLPTSAAWVHTACSTSFYPSFCSIRGT